MSTLIDDLRRDLRSGNSLLIVGSGVSIAATAGERCASWDGLLLDGIEHCVEKKRSLTHEEGDVLRDRLKKADVAGRIDVAQTVQQKLGLDLRRWLRGTVGSLVPVKRGVLDAVHAIGARIATTNYDGLLEYGSSIDPIVLTDSDDTIEFLRESGASVLHLHGHWRRPDSVVLGVDSYEHLISNDVAQRIQQAMVVHHTIVFIGCGDGISDPNIGPLLRWTSRALGDTRYRNYVLCRSQDIESLKAHGVEALWYVPYGDRYEQLEEFLRELKKAPSPVVVQTELPAEEPRPPAHDRAPTLFIGLGGSGGEVILRIKRSTPQEGNADVYLVIDFDRNSSNPGFEVHEVRTFDPAPIANVLIELGEEEKKTEFETIAEWFPDFGNLQRRSVGVMPHGASQVRALGRIGFFLNDLHIQDALAEALTRLDKGRSGATGERPTIVLVSSLAGGTGSGILFDVAIALRRLRPGIPIHACLLLPEIFDSISFRERIYGNAFATLWEIANLKNQHVMFDAKYLRISSVSEKSSPVPFHRVYLFGPWIGDRRPFNDPREAYDQIASILRLASASEIRDAANRGMANSSGDSAAPLSDPSSRNVFSTQSAVSMRLIDYGELADLCAARFLLELESNDRGGDLLDLIAPRPFLRPEEMKDFVPPDDGNRQYIRKRVIAFLREAVKVTPQRLKQLLSLIGMDPALPRTEPPAVLEEIRAAQRRAVLDMLRNRERFCERTPRAFEAFLLALQRKQWPPWSRGELREFIDVEEMSRAPRILLKRRLRVLFDEWMKKSVTDIELHIWRKQAVVAGTNDAIASALAKEQSKWSFLPKMQEALDEYLNTDEELMPTADLDGRRTDVARILRAELLYLHEGRAKAFSESFVALFSSVAESCRHTAESEFPLLVAGWVNQVRELFRRELAVAELQRFRFVSPNSLFREEEISKSIARCETRVFSARGENTRSVRLAWVRLPREFRGRSETGELLRAMCSSMLGAQVTLLDTDDATENRLLIVVDDLFHGGEDINGIFDYYQQYIAHSNPLMFHIHKDWPAQFLPMIRRPEK